MIRGGKSGSGDPCGDGPVSLPTPEETFADLIAQQKESWEATVSGKGDSRRGGERR